MSNFPKNRMKFRKIVICKCANEIFQEHCWDCLAYLVKQLFPRSRRLLDEERSCASENIEQFIKHTLQFFSKWNGTVPWIWWIHPIQKFWPNQLCIEVDLKILFATYDLVVLLHKRFLDRILFTCYLLSVNAAWTLLE